MRDQVTSIGQSHWLLKLGVPAEKASMIWVPNLTFDERTRQFVPTGDYNVCLKHAAYKMMEEELIPAFTVADLLEMLPKKIVDKRGSVWLLHIESYSSTSARWCLFWGDEEVQVGWQDWQSLVDLLVAAVEWVLSNGYKLNV